MREEQRRVIEAIVKRYHRLKEISQHQEFGLRSFGKRVAAAVYSCGFVSFFSLRQNYVTYQNKHKITRHKFLERLKYVASSAYFLGTSVTFSAKIALDYYCFHSNVQYSQFIKGAVVGFLSYIINSPIKQICIAQQSMIDKYKKNISKITTAIMIERLNGVKGFYVGNIPYYCIHYSIFYSLYFGVYEQLTSLSVHPINHYIVNPLLSTVLATIPTFLWANLNNLRQSIIQKRLFMLNMYNRQVMVLPISINGEVWKRKAQILKLKPKDKRHQMTQLLSSWIVLSLFMFCQNMIINKGFPVDGSDSNKVKQKQGAI